MLKFILMLALVFTASVASAADCPKKPVVESGGKHWCYDAGRRGHVHLWKPASYDAKRAVTVVYVHGYNVDGCPDKDYVDCAWDKHGLARQFEASGLNALFVAVEGPVNDGQKAKWASLDALLDSIHAKGGLRPPDTVTVVAHSGGIFTAEKFLGDGRLKHVVALDAAYADAPRRLAAWYRSGRGRRLTLIGAESTSAWTASLGGKLGCASSDDLALPLTSGLKTARCAAVIDATVGHMDVVLEGHVIPMVLSRTVMPKPPPRKTRRHRKR